MKKWLCMLLTLVMLCAAVVPAVLADECSHVYGWRMIGDEFHEEYCTRCGAIRCTGNHKNYCDSGSTVCMECGALASDGYRISHVHQEWEFVRQDDVTDWTCEIYQGGKGDYHVVYCSKCGEVAMNEHHMWNASGVCADCGAGITEMGHVVFCSRLGYCVNCESDTVSRFPSATIWLEHEVDYESLPWVPDPDDNGLHVRLCPDCGGVAQRTNHHFEGGVCTECGYENVCPIDLISSKTLYPGYTFQLEPRQEGLDATYTYASSNNRVVSVDHDGLLTALKKGTATITVTSSNGETATVRVTVPTASVKLNKKNVTLKSGKTFTIVAAQSKAKDPTFTYQSSNKKIAKVSSSGVVTALKKGTATITVKSCYGETAKLQVKVASTKITLNKTKATVNVGATYTITASQPGTAGAKFTYTSSKSSVASVNKRGVVTGVKKGSAVITVKSSYGETAKVKITVK